MAMTSLNNWKRGLVMSKREREMISKREGEMILSMRIPQFRNNPRVPYHHNNL